MNPIAGTRFITPKGFIEKTDLPRNTLYIAIKDGSIPSVRISKRKILIPEDALDRLLAGKEGEQGLKRKRRPGESDRKAAVQDVSTMDDIKIWGPVSLSASETVDDLQTLLKMEEEDVHFGTNVGGDRLNPIRVIPKSGMNWLSYAAKDLARTAGVGPTKVTRIGTRLGCDFLRRLEVWPTLEDLFLARKRAARETVDGRALKQLEAPEKFEWMEIATRASSLYVYALVYTRLNDVAEVAGVTATQIVQVALMISIANTDEWS